MKKILLLCLTLLRMTSYAQVTLYVDSAVTSSGAGTSWPTAYKTVNEALNVANAAPAATKYIINVAKGNYYPAGVQSATNRDSAFCVTRGGISIYGGYPTGGGIRNITTYSTVLNGNIGSLTDSTDNSYHVMVIAGIPATADSIILNGLTLTRGYAGTMSAFTINATSIPRSSGGGLAMVAANNKIYINNCTISSSSAISIGGALRYSGSSCIIDSSSFTGNTSDTSGGSIYNNGSMTLNTCTLSGNIAKKGGAIYNFKGTGLTLNNCTVTGNKANFASSNCGGAGIYNDSAAVVLNSCTVSGNRSLHKGGGIYNNETAYVEINNSTFNADSALDGGALFCYTHPKISGSTFSNNVVTAGGGAIRTNPEILMAGTHVIINCVFSGNKAVDGGGIFSMYFPLNIKNCTFSNNSADYGGGLKTNGPPSTIANCSFLSNTAYEGAGIYNWGGDTTLKISNCLFKGNKANSQGAGIYLQTAAPMVTNCLFSGNRAINGGGIYNYASSPRITNCTFAGDSASSGRSILNYSPTTVTTTIITNCIAWDGSSSIYDYLNGGSSVTYSIVQNGSGTGTGNSIANPLFVNPIANNLAPNTNGDYSLQPCSPAINQGNNTGNYTGITDVAGNTRLYGATIDMGAYEYQGVGPVTPIPGNTSTVCVNSSLQLSNGTGGGIWSTSNGAIATISNTGLVTGVAPGTVTITYTVTGAACINNASKTITVHAPPSNTINATICAGSTYQLGTQTLSAAGTYSNIFQSAAGCDSTIIVNLAVHTVNTAVSQAGPMLTANQAGAVYQWINCSNSTLIAGQTGQSFTAIANGQYAVIITQNGCSDTSACKTVTNVGISSPATAAASVQLYPNPVSNLLRITITNMKPEAIRILDMTGKLVHEVPGAGLSATLDLSGYLPGIYMIEIVGGAEKITRRISIIH